MKSKLDRMALWRAGFVALQVHNTDDATYRTWEQIREALSPLLDAPPAVCLNGIAEELEARSEPTAERYAQTCRRLATQFADGKITVTDLFEMTARLENFHLPPGLSQISEVLRSLGAFNLIDEEKRGLISLTLSVAKAPPQSRFRLGAKLLLKHTPLRDDLSALVLVEALLKEINRQRKAGGLVS